MLLVFWFLFMSLKEVASKITYSPADGNIHWLDGSRVKTRVHSRGYLTMSYKGRNYYVHRVIWCYITGDDLSSADQIDHVNMNKQDNRIENLRLANNALNKQNQGCHGDSKTGVKGVSWSKHNQTYVLNITLNGKRVVSRNYHTLEEAKSASVYYYSRIHSFSPESDGRI